MGLSRIVGVIATGIGHEPLPSERPVCRPSAVELSPAPVRRLCSPVMLLRAEAPQCDYAGVRRLHVGGEPTKAAHRG